MNTVLQNPVLLKPRIGHRLLRKASKHNQEAPDSATGFRRVRAMVGPVVERLPKEEAYRAALQRIPSNLREELFKEEYSKAHARSDISAFQYLELLWELGQRGPLLELLKERLLHKSPEPFGQGPWEASVALAEEVLGDQFPAWWKDQIKKEKTKYKFGIGDMKSLEDLAHLDLAYLENVNMFTKWWERHIGEDPWVD